MRYTVRSHVIGVINKIESQRGDVDFFYPPPSHTYPPSILTSTPKILDIGPRTTKKININYFRKPLKLTNPAKTRHTSGDPKIKESTILPSYFCLIKRKKPKNKTGQPNVKQTLTEIKIHQPHQKPPTSPNKEPQ